MFEIWGKTRLEIETYTSTNAYYKFIPISQQTTWFQGKALQCLMILKVCNLCNHPICNNPVCKCLLANLTASRELCAHSFMQLMQQYWFANLITSRKNCTFNHTFGRCAAIDSITIKQYVAHNQHIWRTWDSCKLPCEAMGEKFAYNNCIVYELSNYQLSLKKAKNWTICSWTSKPHYIIEGMQGT